MLDFLHEGKLYDIIGVYLVINAKNMSSTTQADVEEELIILEDEDSMVQEESIIDFSQTPEAPKMDHTETGLDLGALWDEGTTDIDTLGESLESSSQASDLFRLDDEVSWDEASLETEPVSDLFKESDSLEDLSNELSLEDSGVDASTDDALVWEAQQELTEEVSMDMDIFGADDSAAQDDSSAQDDSMDSILAQTIAKLESRKDVIIKDKESDKAQINTRKAQIKELEQEIAEFDTTIAEITAEQRKITTNIKTLEKMKLGEEQKA